MDHRHVRVAYCSRGKSVSVPRGSACSSARSMCLLSSDRHDRMLIKSFIEQRMGGKPELCGRKFEEFYLLYREEEEQEFSIIYWSEFHCISLL